MQIMAQPRTPGQNFDWSRLALMQANGLAGLGDCSTDESGATTCTDDTGGGTVTNPAPGSVPISSQYDPSQLFNPTDFLQVTGSGTAIVPYSSTSGVDLTTYLNNLTKAGTTLTAIALANPGMNINTSTGQVSYQNPGFSISSLFGTGSGVSTLGGISIGTIMVLGLVAFVVMGWSHK